MLRSQEVNAKLVKAVLLHEGQQGALEAWSILPRVVQNEAGVGERSEHGPASGCQFYE